MGTAYIKANTSHPLRCKALDSSGPMTGLTTIIVRVRRGSDGFWYNWTTSTFESTPAAGDRDKALTELDASRAAGIYGAIWPGSADGPYLAYFHQTDSNSSGVRGATIDIFVGEFAVQVWSQQEGTPANGTFGRAVQVIRKNVDNRTELDLTGGGQLITYDDDGVTPWGTRPVRDGANGPVTLPAGSPARRGART